MQLQIDVCERARLTRDSRFDGRFFVGVITTGIYCRPVCPVKLPKAENVEFFASAAAAAESGYRPCLRCRPECAPGSPAWHGSSVTVRRGLRLIGDGALQQDNVAGLARRLGVTDRHMRRLFKIHLGASPAAVASTQRLHFAKRLLDDTRLTMTQVALAAGYGSVRRFNDQFKKCYGRTPRELRTASKNSCTNSTSGLSLRLPFREPFDWPAMLRFLTGRATPHVEEVSGQLYRRVINLEGRPAVVEVQLDRSPGFVVLTLHHIDTKHLFDVSQIARQALDLDAPIREITNQFAGDARLSASVLRQPGLRVPGAWDGFEVTVRAVLGQQISVKAATTLAGRLAFRYGQKLKTQSSQLSRSFPTPQRLANARIRNLGIIKSRADTIRRVAAATVAGDIAFDATQEPDTLCRQLQSIPGIGAWTAQYVAMRFLKDPDAFPASDLGLLKALVPAETVTPKTLAKRALQWQPWRAYAAMHLWNSFPE